MRTIGFYVSQGFQMLDLAGPAAAFEAANSELGSLAYRIRMLAADEGAVTNSLGMATAAAFSTMQWSIRSSSSADESIRSCPPSRWGDR
jgi:transcriptional regulator GlxA family with amidase domain